MTIKSVLALCLIGVGGLIAFAQDTPPPDRPPRERRPGEPGAGATPGAPGAGPRFVIPLMAALDSNGDGVLDEKEITNASTSLKKLDKNSDGKIDREELRPPRLDRGRPDAPRGEGQGQGQPRPPAQPPAQ